VLFMKETAQRKRFLWDVVTTERFNGLGRLERETNSLL